MTSEDIKHQLIIIIISTGEVENLLFEQQAAWLEVITRETKTAKLNQHHGSI